MELCQTCITGFCRDAAQMTPQFNVFDAFAPRLPPLAGDRPVLSGIDHAVARIAARVVVELSAVVSPDPHASTVQPQLDGGHVVQAIVPVGIAGFGTSHDVLGAGVFFRQYVGENFGVLAIVL